jgi:hypothetical protein
MALSGTFYEVEHFRHLWTWLGLLAALTMVLERDPRRPRGSLRRPREVARR